MAFGVGVEINQQAITAVKADFNNLLKNLQQISNSNPIQIRIENGQEQITQINNSLNGLNGNVQNSNNGFKTMGSSIQSLTGFFLKWLSVATAVNFAIKELKSGLSEIVDINRANVNVAMITESSLEDVQKMNAGVLEMAKSLHIVNSEVLSGQESWLRSGVSMEEANKNLETTTKLAKIAGDSNKDMADSLIVIKNSYDLNSKSLEGYASKVALLDNTSATSSQKINSAMQYSAETFKSMGVDMDTALSYITNFSEKSAKSGESIGRGFASMLDNFHKIQTGVKDGDGQATDAVNHLEQLLSSKGIAIRKSKDDWIDLGTVIKNIQENIGKFSQVDQSQLATLIGGKQQNEMTLSTLNNMARIDELNSKLKNDSGAQSLNNSYAKYLQGIDANIANLKNSVTEFWMTMVSSSSINKFVGGMTGVVDTIRLMSTDFKGLSVDLVAFATVAILVGKNFTSLNFILQMFIFSVKQFGVMTSLTTSLSAGFEILAGSIKAVTVALLTNPWTYVATAIALATVAVISYVNHQKELKKETEELTSSYKNLKQAIDDADISAIKQQSKPLGDKEATLQKALHDQESALKRIKEIQDAVASSGGDRSIATGYASELTNLNGIASKSATTIKEVTKELNDSGLEFNSATGEVYAYTQAQLMISNNNIVEKIKNESNAEFNNKQNIISLIKEYENLSAIENRNATQKERMSQLTEELGGNISNLKVTRDAEGNSVISNSDLLDKQIGILQTEGSTVQTLTNVKLDAAKKDAEIEIGKTQVTYAQAKKRIEILKAEADSQAKPSSSYGLAGMSQAYSAEQQANMDESSNLQSGVDAIDKIYAIPTIIPTIKSQTTPGYKPEKEVLKSSSTSEVQQTVNEIDATKTALSSLTEATDLQQKSLTTLSTTAKKYTDAKDYQNAIKTETDLLEKQTERTKELQTTKEKADKIGIQIKADLSKAGIAIDDTTTKSDLEKIWNDKYGGTHDFGKGESAKQAKEAFDLESKSVKTLINNWGNYGSTVDKISGSIEKNNNDIMESTNKIIELQNTSIKKVVDSQKAIDQGNLDTTQAKIKAEQDVLDLKKQQADTDQEAVDRAEKLLDISKLQTEVTNLQNNKNIQTMTQKSDGSYQYSYVADQGAIDSKQDELKKAQTDYSKWESDNNLKHQQVMINTEQKSYDAQKLAFDNFYKVMDSATVTNLATLNTKFEGGYDTIFKTIQGKVQAILAESSKLNGVGSGALPTDLNASKSANAVSSDGKSITVNTEIDKAMLQAVVGSNVAITVSAGNGAQGSDRDATLKLNKDKLGIGYATGTENATSGIHPVSENGIELVTGSQLKNFKGGESVLNANITKNLMKLGTNPLSYIQNLMPNFQNITPNFNNLNKSSGDITQHVTVNADFSGVNSKSEIESAFKDVFGDLEGIARQKMSTHYGF